MGINSLEVTAMSATDLKDLKVLHRMDPFVIVSLCGSNKQKTSVHKNGGPNPRWSDRLAFPVDEAAARAGDLILEFEIMTQKSLHREDKWVASVDVPINTPLEQQGDGNSTAIRYHVGLQPQGNFHFSYKFSEAVLTPQPQDANQEHKKKSGGGKVIRSLFPCAGELGEMMYDLCGDDGAEM